MCDFPNVENNDAELEALSEFCEEWSRRITSLDLLFGQGHLDESLVLCCCYMEAVGTWLYNREVGGEEAFAGALLRYGENEAFRRINPVRLLSRLRRQDAGSEEWGGILSALQPVFAGFQDRYYPEAEVTGACRQALQKAEYALLENSLWMGTFACLTHGITRCEGVRQGSFSTWNSGEIRVDFHLFFPVLRRLFESARVLIMSGRLRIY